MIETNEAINEFIGKNWLGIILALNLLKGLAMQFKIKWLHKLYLVLQGALKIIRPSTGTLPEVPVKVRKVKKRGKGKG